VLILRLVKNSINNDLHISFVQLLLQYIIFWVISLLILELKVSKQMLPQLLEFLFKVVWSDDIANKFDLLLDILIFSGLFNSGF